MKDLKIGKKLFVTFAIILAVFLAAVVVSIFGLSYGGSQFTDFYSYSYPLSNKTVDIRRGIQTSIKALGLSMLTDDVQETNSFIEKANTQMEEAGENLNYMLENFRGDKSKIQKALDTLTKADEYRMQIQELAASNRNEEASELFFSQYNPLVLEVRDLMTEMDQNTTVLADATYENAYRAQTAVTFAAILVSAVAVLLTVFMAVYLTKMIKRPIAEIEAAAKEMAQGNLNVQVNYRAKDELGVLADNIRIMTSRISDYMGKISDATIQLSEGDLNIAHQDEFLGDFRPTQMAIRKLINSLNSAMG